MQPRNDAFKHQDFNKVKHLISGIISWEYVNNSQSFVEAIAKVQLVPYELRPKQNFEISDINQTSNGTTSQPRHGRSRGCITS